MQNSVKVLCISLIFLHTLSLSYAASSLRLAFLPGSDALEEVIEEIKRARVSIDLGLFYLTHDAIIDALCYKASQKNARGQRLLKVRIYVDATMGNPTYKKDMQRLMNAGAEIYLEDLAKRGKLHGKCGVIDGQTVISGSANWTEFGFGEKGDSANFEDIVIIKDDKIAWQYLRAFDKIAKHSKPYPYDFSYNAEHKSDNKSRNKSTRKTSYKFPAKKTYQITDKMQARERSRDVKHFRLAQTPKVFFSPSEMNDKNVRVFPEIITSINNAKRKINICMFAISDDKIEAALIAAIKRGVQTRLVADEWMASGRMRDVLQKFYDAGAQVFYYHKLHGSMHLKVMVLDDELENVRKCVMFCKCGANFV